MLAFAHCGKFPYTLRLPDQRSPQKLGFQSWGTRLKSRRNSEEERFRFPLREPRGRTRTVAHGWRLSSHLPQAAAVDHHLNGREEDEERPHGGDRQLGGSDRRRDLFDSLLRGPTHASVLFDWPTYPPRRLAARGPAGTGPTVGGRQGAASLRGWVDGIFAGCSVWPTPAAGVGEP